MAERERKLSENEAVFRAFNEGVRDVEERLKESPRIEVVCECSDTSCEERIEMRLEEYAEVRDSPIRFVVRRGHEVSPLERVVHEEETYSDVEKRSGEAADAAREDDRG